jgi:uncharacterized Tic20 family protein
MREYNKRSFWEDFWRIIAVLLMSIGIFLLIGVLSRWAMIGVITVFHNPTLFNLLVSGLFLTLIGLVIMFIVEEYYGKA